MNLSRLQVVFRKEMLDGIRDRRSLMSVGISALIGPLLVGFMFNRLAERQREAQDIQIPVVGAERAPALINWLEQQDGVEIVEGPQDAEEAVRERDEDVVVVIDEEFGKDFSEARPARVKLVADGSRQTAQPKVRRVRRLIQRYSQEIAVLRLIVRGVSPAIATPIRVEYIEVSSSQQRAATLLNFIPMFVVLAAFMGGDANRNGYDRGRAGTRVVGIVAGQPGAARIDRHRKMAGGRRLRGLQRGAEVLPVPGGVAAHPSERVRHTLRYRSARNTRRAWRYPADGPAGDGTADLHCDVRKVL